MTWKGILQAMETQNFSKTWKKPRRRVSRVAAHLSAPHDDQPQSRRADIQRTEQSTTYGNDFMFPNNPMGNN